MSTRVAIHQPEFLGWLGFYRKMAASDVYVILDDVQYIKRGFLQRNRYKSKDGVKLLTVPVATKGRFTQLIREVEILYQPDWRASHIESLKHAYARAPHLAEFLPVIEAAYAVGHQRLAELTTEIFKAVAGLLAITPRFVAASELGVASESTQRLIDLTKAVGGDTYVSGAGGREYMDMELFRTAGVSVEFSEYHPKAYPQQHGPFEPAMCVFDALFNVGIEETRALIQV